MTGKASSPGAARKPIKRNPGAARFDENEAYETHRGYYYKDAAGRWRSPDGRSVAGQKKERSTDSKGRVRERFVSREAERYNEKRHVRLRVIDATNYLRVRGHVATLKQGRAALGVAVRPRTRPSGRRKARLDTFEGPREGRGSDGGFPDDRAPAGGGEPNTVHDWFDGFDEEVPDVIDSWGDTP
jgi:hypothetical protein